MEPSDQTRPMDAPRSFNSNFSMPMIQHLLLKEINTGHNFVFSPVSFQAMLSLVASAAAGNDLTQLLDFLGLSNVLDLYSSSMRLVDVASHTHDGESSNNDRGSASPILSFVTSLWLDQCFHLKPSFKGIAEAIFRAETKDIDFATRGSEVTLEINSWVKTTTKGLVNDVIPATSLDRATVLVLANAIYFKGAWDRKFDQSKTTEKEFHMLNGDIVRVPFMTSGKREKHLYFRSRFDDSRILKIPYQRNTDDRHFSMYFFLPGEVNGLPKLLQNASTNQEYLTQDFELREEILRDFWIPRFTFSYAFEASKVLKELGITAINNGLTEMIINNSKNEKSWMSEVYHKSYIEVNEEGTEAAASTAVRIIRKCARIPPPAFVADHPFMFMIREDVSKTVFFSGVVLNPMEDS